MSSLDITKWDIQYFFHWLCPCPCFGGRNLSLCAYFLLIAPWKELNPAQVGASGRFKLLLYIHIQKYLPSSISCL